MSKDKVRPLPKPKKKKVDKLTRVIDFIENFDDEKFSGFVRINFSQGNVGRVEKLEQVYKKDENE